MDVIMIIVEYFAAMNIINFLLMGIDKWKAQKGAFRIPESTLFIISLIGGSIGCVLGMYIFRHKTRQWHFVLTMLAILLLQTGLYFFLTHYSSITFQIM